MFVGMDLEKQTMEKVVDAGQKYYNPTTETPQSAMCCLFLCKENAKTKTDKDSTNLHVANTFFGADHDVHFFWILKNAKSFFFCMFHCLELAKKHSYVPHFKQQPNK